MSSERCLDPRKDLQAARGQLIWRGWELQEQGEKLRGKGRGRPRKYQGKRPSATLQPHRFKCCLF